MIKKVTRFNLGHGLLSSFGSDVLSNYNDIYVHILHRLSYLTHSSCQYTEPDNYMCTS